MVTPLQRETIETLRIRVGWIPDGLDGFLNKTFGLTMATLAKRDDASRAIHVLRKILDHAVVKQLDEFSRVVAGGAPS